MGAYAEEVSAEKLLNLRKDDHLKDQSHGNDAEWHQCLAHRLVRQGTGFYLNRAGHEIEKPRLGSFRRAQ